MYPAKMHVLGDVGQPYMLKDPELLDSKIECELLAGNFFEAIKLLSEITVSINSKPKHFTNLSYALIQTGNFTEAIQICELGLSKFPKQKAIEKNLGLALLLSNRFTEALRTFDTLVKSDNTNIDYKFHRGLSLFSLGHYELALGDFSECEQKLGHSYELLLNIGACLFKLKFYNKSKIYLGKVISSDARPVLRARALNNLGSICSELKDWKSALEYFDLSVQIDPEYFDARINRGVTYNQISTYELALADYRYVFERDPEHPLVRGRLLHQKMICSDWDGSAELLKRIEADVELGKPVIEPFAFQALTDNPSSLLKCAAAYARTIVPNTISASKFRFTRKNKKIKLGFVSGEFRDHATLILLIGLLEQLDKKVFEIYCFDSGYSDGSILRKRLEAVSTLVQIVKANDDDAAKLIQDLKIDILFDLNTFFGEFRPGIFARRPAGVQINYLGFPGTSGSSFMDYIIGDDVVIPTSHDEFFTESVIRLPNCYQPNDDCRSTPKVALSKREEGLPEAGFVFCCFNNTYKITPHTFSLWMTILESTPNSVLWLLRTSETGMRNLKLEAAKHYIDPNRIIFGGRVRQERHLARHCLADLFLDTLPYNAHTTASDSLWAGLPVLTQVGNSFSGRVSASLLKAVGVAEHLVTASDSEYVNKAIHFYNNPEYTRELRNLLISGRFDVPLFDTRGYARNFGKTLLSIREISGGR